jgi:hypothetical protein
MLDCAATHMDIYPLKAEHTAPNPNPKAAIMPRVVFPNMDSPVVDCGLIGRNW